jgi:hypothetical protein
MIVIITQDGYQVRLCNELKRVQMLVTGVSNGMPFELTHKTAKELGEALLLMCK